MIDTDRGSYTAPTQALSQLVEVSTDFSGYGVRVKYPPCFTLQPFGSSSDLVTLATDAAVKKRTGLNI